jgi:hypothetical protein
MTKTTKTRAVFVDWKIEIDGTLSADPKPIAPERIIDLLSFVLAHVCSESPRVSLCEVSAHPLVKEDYE